MVPWGRCRFKAGAQPLTAVAAAAVVCALVLAAVFAAAQLAIRLDHLRAIFLALGHGLPAQISHANQAADVCRLRKLTDFS